MGMPRRTRSRRRSSVPGETSGPSAMRIGSAGDLDLAVALGLQLADQALEIIGDQRGVGPDGVQGPRDHPLRLVSPGRGERPLFRIPLGLVVIPVAHDLVHRAAVDAARRPLRRLDEVAEQLRARLEGRVIDVAIEGLVQAVHDLRHAHLPSPSHARALPPAHALSPAVARDGARAPWTCTIQSRRP